MNWDISLFKPNCPINGFLYVLMAIWFPLCFVKLGEYWTSHNTDQIVFWLIITMIYVVMWPLATMRLLTYLRFNRLWILLLLLPVVMLVCALFEHWSLVAKVSVAVVAIAPLPLVFLSPQKSSTATQLDSSDEPHS
ncbi:MAG TPA: hypothetical protein VGE85_02110 [Terracidiphilus sp.]|jgi:hypothetical protein